MIDPTHYFDRIGLPDGEHIFRHWYFTEPKLTQGRKVTTALVRIMTEEIVETGRKFTRVDIFPYGAPRCAEIEMKFTDGRDEGYEILGTSSKVKFVEISAHVPEPKSVAA